MNLGETNLGEKIRLARNMLGLSQEDLAARIGKDQKAVSKYELGQRRLFASDLPKLAHALEIPIWYFFEDALSSSEVDNEILKQIHNLPNQDAQVAALDLLRVFSKAIKAQSSE